MSEWLDLLIEEIDRKKRELDEARAESRRRESADPSPDDRADPQQADQSDDTPDASK